MRFGFAILFSLTNSDTVVLYFTASSDKVSPHLMVIFFVFSGVGSFPPPSSGGSTGGIVELSSKNTSFVNLSLSYDQAYQPYF